MSDPIAETLDLYTIRSAPHGSGDWLLVKDDEALYALAEELEERSELGRINCAPLTLQMRSAFEGETSHYSEKEIVESMKGTPLPYTNLGGLCYLVSDDFVAALEGVGAALRAHPVTLVHHERSWSFWLVTYVVQDVYLPNLREVTVPAFFDREQKTVAFYSRAARNAIEALGWPWITFMLHSVPRCHAMPVGEGSEADKTLVTAIGAMFLAKVPSPKVGSGYDAIYFLDRLKTRYSDATSERVQQAIACTPDAGVFYELKDGALDAIGVRPDSVLARRLTKAD